MELALEKAKEEKLKKEHPFMHIFLNKNNGGLLKGSDHDDEELKNPLTMDEDEREQSQPDLQISSADISQNVAQ